MSTKSEDEQIQTGLGFLREETESPGLNGGLSVHRQKPAGRSVSSEGSSGEALCQGLPLYSQICQNFSLQTSTSEYSSEIYIVLCLWLLSAGQVGLPQRERPRPPTLLRVSSEKGLEGHCPTGKNGRKNPPLVSGLTCSDTEDDLNIES